jgi:Fe-S-cluster containining protein
MQKARYDCAQCPGYCCSYARISVTDRDIARLARHFDIDVDTARRRFTYRYQSDDTDEWILRHRKDTVFTSMCRFFDQDARRCTVYAARPQVCRRYPYGTKCGYYEFLKFEREQQGDPNFIPSA